MVERRLPKPVFAGSIPVLRSKTIAVMALGGFL